MMVELQAKYLVLKRWSKNTAATKKEIGVWQHWKQCKDSDYRPLAEVEVERIKAIFRQGAPTSYFEIFANERN